MVNKIIITAKTKEPEINELKKNKIPLTDEERKDVLAAKAIWHHGPNGEPSPAIHKAKINDKIWYYCNTHRAYRVSPTLKGSIEDYKFIETTSNNKNLIKLAGRKRIKDRGITWKERYHKRSLPLKERFDKEIGPQSYMRWEGHDYTTDSDYFVVVSPSLTKEMKKRFFAGIKKLPKDPKAKVYAPYGEYFSTIEGAYSYVSDKWGVPFPKNAPHYTLNDLMNVKIPRHIKADNKEETIKISQITAPPIATPGVPAAAKNQGLNQPVIPQQPQPVNQVANQTNNDLVNRGITTDDAMSNILNNLETIKPILAGIINNINNGEANKDEIMSSLSKIEEGMNSVRTILRLTQ